LKISQARNQHEACKELLLDSLALFVDPEDGGETFLSNIGQLSTNYTALHRRKWNSS
jgi:hypothetical protein